MKKSLKNNFGFLKNYHRRLKIGAAVHRPQKKFLNKMFQIVRLSILGKVIFKAPFKRYRKKNMRGGVESPPRSSRVKPKFVHQHSPTPELLMFLKKQNFGVNLPSI